jgi:cobalt-zinc-cadmium resistance protein CzcA
MIDVQDTVAIAVGGRDAGVFYQGDRRFDIGVRLPEGIRADVEALRRLPIPLPKGTNAATSYIPLGEVATLSIAPGPNQISGKTASAASSSAPMCAGGSRHLRPRSHGRHRHTREDPHRLLDCLGWHVRAVAVGNGTAPNRRAVALLMVFVLLFAMFGNVRDGLIVFTGIPFALTGGVLALWMRGIPLSISAAVGFIALSVWRCSTDWSCSRLSARCVRRADRSTMPCSTAR